MSVVIHWLEQRPTGSEYWKIIFLAFAFDIAWSIVIISIYGAVVGLPEMDSSRQVLLEMAFWKIIPLLILVSFVEEILFRYVPLTVALLIYSRNAAAKSLVLVVVIVLSLIFGYMHGDSPLFLLLQGMGGLIYSTVFLKVSGMNFRHTAHAFRTVWAMHAVWNIGTVGLASITTG